MSEVYYTTHLFWAGIVQYLLVYYTLLISSGLVFSEVYYTLLISSGPVLYSIY